MAYAKILMSNGVEIKTAPVGYSWTVFFWGGWPAIFRQDWLWGVCMLLGCLITYGFAGIVCSFFYNKVYIKTLFDKGYKVTHYPPNVTPETLAAYLGYISLPGSEPKV